MAVKTLGTTSTTALNAIQFQPVQGVGVSSASSLLPAADLAAINSSIMGPGRFDTSKPTGILATGSTHTNTALDTLVLIAGGPLASIRVGYVVLGVGIPPGTFVTAIGAGSTSVTLSQAATASASIRVAIVPPSGESGRLAIGSGQLVIPGRGTLNLKYGDWVAIDNTGWPILLTNETLAYAGTLWAHS